MPAPATGTRLTLTSWSLQVSLEGLGMGRVSYVVQAWLQGFYSARLEGALEERSITSLVNTLSLRSRHLGGR
jgi:hypothetical protein